MNIFIDAKHRLKALKYKIKRKRATFNDLPKDMFVTICDYLTWRDLKQIGRICRKYRNNITMLVTPLLQNGIFLPRLYPYNYKINTINAIGTSTKIISVRPLLTSYPKPGQKICIVVPISEIKLGRESFCELGYETGENEYYRLLICWEGGKSTSSTSRNTYGIKMMDFNIPRYDAKTPMLNEKNQTFKVEWDENNIYVFATSEFLHRECMFEKEYIYPYFKIENMKVDIC